MATNISDLLQRELNLNSRDATLTNSNTSSNRLSRVPSLSRKLSDRLTSDNSTYDQQQQQQQQQQQPSTLVIPLIDLTDHSDGTSLHIRPTTDNLSNQRHSNSGYDTDGAIGAPRPIARQGIPGNGNYEYLISPRLPRRPPRKPVDARLSAGTDRSNQLETAPFVTNAVYDLKENTDDRNEEPNHDADFNRRHVRQARRVHLMPSPNDQDKRRQPSPRVMHPERLPIAMNARRPLRLIFMRHAERVNQALGSEWFWRAFRTGEYNPYDKNLPMILPRRRNKAAFEFDVPLTVRGLRRARHSGTYMMNSHLIADVCLSSNALRCIQTAERILSGMNLREHIPIRIEPGLFECPHYNHKIVESFMSKSELVENGYNIKSNYKPLVERVDVPESFDGYFQRCATVMQGIISRYTQHGGTVLIVTHAPCLLALTDAIKNKQTSSENFYHIVGAYPPLAVWIADYDGRRWKLSEQPFSLPLGGQ